LSIRLHCKEAFARGACARCGDRGGDQLHLLGTADHHPGVLRRKFPTTPEAARFPIGKKSEVARVTMGMMI